MSTVGWHRNRGDAPNSCHLWHHLSAAALRYGPCTSTWIVEQSAVLGGRIAGELTLALLQIDSLGTGVMPSPTCPSPPVAVGRADHEVRRVGELALPLTSCSTWQSGPCTSPGQPSRAGPHGGGTGEQAMRPGKLAQPVTACREGPAPQLAKAQQSWLWCCWGR